MTWGLIVLGCCCCCACSIYSQEFCQRDFSDGDASTDETGGGQESRLGDLYTISEEEGDALIVDESGF